MPQCSYTNTSEERMQNHIQKEHNLNKKTKSKTTQFANLDVTPAENESARQTRGRHPRPTPYERTRESSSRSQSPYEQPGVSSSRSRSPSQRTSLETLSPLQIPSPLSHLPALSAPSPLSKLAYSRPNTPPLSLDDKMEVDEDEALPNDNEILAKGSFVVISLPYLQTSFPPIRLIGCTKCNQGVLASSLLTHAKDHNITLLPDEKLNLQSIAESKFYVDDSIQMINPVPPCPSIEGIKIQDGFSCNLCNYCSVTKKTMMFHFSKMHKGVPGHSKGNSKPAHVQAFFALRPKYFAVTPILCGLDKDDPFSAYVQQCVPEIEALKILNPPLNPNEVPPLLKVTQWHEHLKDYTGNRDSVRKLLELTQLPTLKNGGKAWMGSPLRNTIEGYMKDVRVKAHSASIGIRCLLKECPRFV